jgi:hypothetical protein
MNVNLSPHNSSYLMGPHRVFPGRLSVSRTFGDVQHKHSQFGGLNNVIIATPEISFFRIQDSIDFMVLGCDGIYDVLTNDEIVQAIWMTTLPSHRCENIHTQTALGVDMIIKTCLIRKALDNISFVLISFSNFERHIIDSIKMNVSVSSENKESNKVLKDLQSDKTEQNRCKSNKNVLKDLEINHVKVTKNAENEEAKIVEVEGNYLKKNSKESGSDCKETENEEEDYKTYKRQNLEFHSGVGNTEPEKNNKVQKIIKTIMDIERWDSEIKESLSPEINYQNFRTKHKESNEENTDS